MRKSILLLFIDPKIIDRLKPVSKGIEKLFQTLFDEDRRFFGSSAITPLLTGNRQGEQFDGVLKMCRVNAVSCQKA